MLTGKLIKVEVQFGNQINLEVFYQDKDTGFSRNNIFTIPSSDVDRLANKSGIEDLIRSQGLQYKVVAEKKSFFDDEINKEIII